MAGTVERIFFSRNPTAVEAYGVAAALVLAALLLRWAMSLIAGNVLPFSTLYPAVIFATLYAGARPGAVAAAIGGALVWWMSIPTSLSNTPPIGRDDQVHILAYICGIALIVWGGSEYRKMAMKLAAEIRFRQLSVEELAHRLKNKVATIDAILRQQLPDDPVLREEVSGRLMALARTDDLVARTQSVGARLEDIVAAELGPYDGRRFEFNGPSIMLPPTLAASVALTLHELATNAAKYGALSTPDGRVRIEWSVASSKVALSWTERGGPSVAGPTRSGFGARLFARALIDFDGSVAREFAPEGLRASLAFTVPRAAAA